MTKTQAYQAVLNAIKTYYESTGQNEIKYVLANGNYFIKPDQANPFFWHCWLEGIRAAKQGSIILFFGDTIPLEGKTRISFFQAIKDNKWFIMTDEEVCGHIWSSLHVYQKKDSKFQMTTCYNLENLNFSKQKAFEVYSILFGEWKLVKGPVLHGKYEKHLWHTRNYFGLTPPSF